MALINLLPWREELRQEKQKEFLGILMLVLILALVAAFAWHSVVQSNIENQQSRNKMLQDNIKLLENDLKEIKKLEETKKLWLARMDVIQGLQSNRAEVVKLFDQLARTIPDGAFLSGLELAGDSKLTVKGFARTNRQVSTLMRQADQADKFNNSFLKNIEKDTTLGEDGQSFEFTLDVVQPKSLNDESNNNNRGEG